MSRAEWGLLLTRVFVGLVFVYSGLEKLSYPYMFAETVAAYEILPGRLVSLVALTLPWLELLAGGCLLFGFLGRSAAAVLGGLSVIFAVAVALAVSAGKEIHCGCFDLAGWSQVSYGHMILDLFLLGACLLLLHLGPGKFAIDGNGANPGG